MVKQVVVLYPSSGISHLVPMVELGKLITKHHPSFSITILITIQHSNTSSTQSYMDTVSKSNPSINFHCLPTIPSHSSNTGFARHQALDLNNPLIHNALQTISASSTIPAFIIDMFCCSSIQVADQFHIPVYLFFTSNINALSIFLHFPTLHRNTTKSIKDMDTPLHFPGLPPIDLSDMIRPLLDRTTEFYERFLYNCSQYPKTRGIIVNSFQSLEPRALKAVKDGLCIPDSPTPPVYCIGPLMASQDQTSDTAGEESCLEWLDLQPRRSVVFLCFGSRGTFSETQLKEIAIGLEKSGQRFLWVVRAPTADGLISFDPAPRPEPDLDAILPHGFLERTKERGMVVTSWVPQVQVLNKESVGGFVTHCGWNSVLEALYAGVPMVGWPLYAEQRLNRVILVKEMKVALPMEEGEDGFVKAEEVEKRVRGLIESVQGRVIREQTVKLSGEAKAAIDQGGSSVSYLADLAELWKSATE